MEQRTNHELMKLMVWMNCECTCQKKKVRNVEEVWEHDLRGCKRLLAKSEKPMVNSRKMHFDSLETSETGSYKGQILHDGEFDPGSG